MREQVILSADSPAEMPQHVLRRLGVQFMPLYVNLQGRSLRDGAEVTAADVFALYAREKVIATTSAGSVGDYEAHFRQVSSGGARPVVHFCIGGKISSSYDNASIAARDCPGVFVIDSESMSVGLSLQLLYADALRAQGQEARMIAFQAESYKKRVRTTALLHSLTFMRRGGRCSAVSALGANLLGIRPVVQMLDGQAGVYKKLRGRPALAHAQYIDDLLERPGDIDGAAAFLYHTGLPLEEFYAAEEYVRSYGIFGELHTGQAGAVTSTHLGERCLLLVFAYR
jgi:DegV family protein with EDD domain